MKRQFYIQKPKLIFYLSVFTIFLIVLYLWRMDTPYPYTLDWDILAHQSLANAFFNGKLALLPSQISDTFLVNTYLPFFGILLGMGKMIFWFLTYLQYYFILDSLYLCSVIFLSAVITYRLSKNYWISLISALFSGFIFESVIAQTAFFFVPQGFAALLVIIGLYQFISEKYREAMFVLLFTLPLHFVIGGLGIGLVIALLVTKYVYQKIFIKIDQSTLYLSLGVLILITAILSNYVLSLNLLNTSESTIYSLTLAERFFYFNRWYSILSIFFIFGLFNIWKQKENPQLIFVTFIGLLVLAAVFMPIPYSFKFYTVGRFFVHMVMAYGIYFLVRDFTSVIIRALSVLALMIVLIIIFTYNQLSFKQILTYQDVRTTVSLKEEAAAQYLANNFAYSDDLLLVSDPATQHIFEALTGINTAAGAFMSDANRQIVDSVYPQTDSSAIKSLLFQIRDGIITLQPKRILFVVSGRFFNWQYLDDEHKFDEGYNIWAPRDITQIGLQYIQMLDLDPKFKPVYRNDSVAIYELTND